MMNYFTLHARAKKSERRIIDTFVSKEASMTVAEKKFQQSPMDWEWYYLEQNGVVIKDWINPECEGEMNAYDVHWHQIAATNYLKALLDEQGVEYRSCGKTSFAIDDVDGCISVIGPKVRFLHCNAELAIGVNDERLPEWVRAYAEGNDEFARVAG